MNQLKHTFILISLALCVAFIIVAMAFVYILGLHARHENNVYTCTCDADCIAIRADACGCNQGGADTAINKAYKQWWKAEHPAGICIQIISDDPSCIDTVPKCIKNRCELVKISE